MAVISGGECTALRGFWLRFTSWLPWAGTAHDPTPSLNRNA